MPIITVIHVTVTEKHLSHFPPLILSFSLSLILPLSFSLLHSSLILPLSFLHSLILPLSSTEPHSHHGDEGHGHSHQSEESHDHGHSHGADVLHILMQSLLITQPLIM